MKYQKGFKFIDNRRVYEIIEFMEQFKMYRLRNFTNNKENELMKESEIDSYVSRKEEILAKREKSRIFNEKQDALIKAEQEKELKEKQDYYFCYGYIDNKTDLQKGKILKILNIKEHFNGQYISRKNLIHKLIHNYNDIELEIYKNTNRYSKKRVCLTYKKLVDKIEYRIHYNKNHLLEVTKTEYSYIKYLIETKRLQKTI